MTKYKLRDPNNTPPKGFTWIDPITTLRINTRNHSNWLTEATNHRSANALPIPDVGDMEDQLCRSYDDRTRSQVCMECDGSDEVKRLGVGGMLKSMLANVGIAACWSCTKIAEKMDSWGPDGCERNMPEIVETMKENSIQSKWTKY